MADYEPKGDMVVMGDIECYVAWPSQATKHAVIVFQDVFGINTGRHKQFCDMLADKGYGAVAPDFTGKDPIVSNPPKYGITFGCFAGFACAMCCGRYGRRNKELSWDNSMGHLVLDCVVPWMKQKGATKLATVGFCWGSYGAMYCGKVPEIFCCNASFHPSTESFCKSTQEDDLSVCRNAKVPQLVVATSMESDKWKPGGAAQQACEEDGTKSTWMLEETQKHGFMMRGDTSNVETLSAIKKYTGILLDFFESNMCG
jgi:dienelactone hydrolase